RRRGEIERAIVLFYEALSRDGEAGLISDFVLDGLVLSLTLRDNGRHLAEARAVLDAIEPAASVFPEGRAMVPSYRALLSSAVGDLRAAIRLSDASDELSERLSLDAHRVDVFQRKADVLSTLGRHDEARDLLQRAEALLFARGANPCPEAQWQNNVGW